MIVVAMAVAAVEQIKSAKLAREDEGKRIVAAVSGLPEAERAAAAYKLRCERDAANASIREAAALERMAMQQESKSSSGDLAMAGVLGFIFGSAIS